MGWFAALAPVVASMIGGAANSAIKNRTAKGGEMGYDTLMLSNSPYDAENMRLMAALAQSSALNAQAGRLDPGQEILLDKIKKFKMQQAKEQMYGRPGERGGSIMDNTMSAGAQAGVGAKPMMAQVSKAMNDYSGRQSQIMNYIDSLKLSGLQNQRNQSFNMMRQMPRSNEIPYQGRVVPMNTPAQPGMETGLGDVDWTSILDKWGGSQPTGQTFADARLGGGIVSGDTMEYGGKTYPISSPRDPNMYRPSIGI